MAESHGSYPVGGIPSRTIHTRHSMPLFYFSLNLNRNPSGKYPPTHRLVDVDDCGVGLPRRGQHASPCQAPAQRTQQGRHWLHNHVRKDACRQVGGWGRWMGGRMRWLDSGGSGRQERKGGLGRQMGGAGRRGFGQVGGAVAGAGSLQPGRRGRLRQIGAGQWSGPIDVAAPKTSKQYSSCAQHSAC